MPTLLTNLKLTELSFVPSGANKGAKVTILKHEPTLPPCNPFLPPLTKGARKPAVEREAARRIEEATKPAEVSVAERERLSRLLDDEDEAMEPFEKAVAEQRKLNPRLSRIAAMSAVRKARPDLFEKYQAADPNGSPNPVAKSDAVLKFEGLIDKVQARDGCSRLEAMTRVAREFPDARESYARA